MTNSRSRERGYSQRKEEKRRRDSSRDQTPLDQASALAWPPSSAGRPIVPFDLINFDQPFESQPSRGANWTPRARPPPQEGNDPHNWRYTVRSPTYGMVPNISTMELPGVPSAEEQAFNNAPSLPSSSNGSRNKGKSIASQRNSDRMSPFNGITNLRDSDQQERHADAEQIHYALLTDPNRVHPYDPPDPMFNSIAYRTDVLGLVSKRYPHLPQGCTRYVRFYNVNPQEMEEEVLGRSAIGRVKSIDVMLKVIGIRKLDQFNEYVLRFDDIRDAVAAHDELKALNRWPVEFVRPAYYHNIPGVETPFWTPNESAVVMHVFARNRNGWLASPDFAAAVPTLKGDLRQALEFEYGDCIQGIHEEPGSGDRYISFKVCFYAVTTADTVARDWSNGYVAFSQSPRSIELFFFCRFYEARQNPMCYLTGRNHNVPVVRHGGTSAPGNQVEPANIISGRDVRTTVMLRNIPNKFQSFELKRILDWVCKGRFDFSYLRVDFNNRCNVGYAFINFLEPQDILPFYEALAFVKWNVFNSDKVAQICYATIQGLECLVERFRNSGVSTQWPPFRAKIWFIFSDFDNIVDRRLIGTLKPFPPPNNRVKLQRSLDNAYHVGLFPPRPGDKYWRRAVDNQDDAESRHLDNRDPTSRRYLVRGSWANTSHLSHATSGPVPPHMRNMTVTTTYMPLSIPFPVRNDRNTYAVPFSSVAIGSSTATSTYTSALTYAAVDPSSNAASTYAVAGVSSSRGANSSTARPSSSGGAGSSYAGPSSSRGASFSYAGPSSSRGAGSSQAGPSSAA